MYGSVNSSGKGAVSCAFTAATYLSRSELPTASELTAGGQSPAAKAICRDAVSIIALRGPRARTLRRFRMCSPFSARQVYIVLLCLVMLCVKHMLGRGLAAARPVAHGLEASAVHNQRGALE